MRIMKTMAKKGYKFNQEQIERLKKSHIGQIPWNKGTGGCKNGHDPSLYKQMPSGVYVCLGCKKVNGKKYRDSNINEIRLKNRAARYKVDLEFILNLYKNQNGRCAICGKPIAFENSRIDHNHSTGKIRGILCTSCNSGIGLFMDSAEILIIAANYILKNE